MVLTPQAIADLKEKALTAGEQAQLHWYADDRSDDPVDPPATLRLLIDDREQAATFLAEGEGVADDGAVRLADHWNCPRPQLSYVRVWADAVVRAFGNAGVALRADIRIPTKLDTASLLRGLSMIPDPGRISVEDILAGRKLYISRVGDGPFVLEMTAEQIARGADWLASMDHPVLETADGGRMHLGTDPKTVANIVVLALRELAASPATTLVARHAPGGADPWPGQA